MLGVLAAVLSSGLGGSAVAATRFLRGATDPVTLAALRFGLGFVFLLPVACLGREPWPSRADWLSVGGLGLLFFGLFPVLFNAGLVYTTASRGALALSTLPVLTMVAAALLGMEKLTLRKTVGVLVAIGGVALSLITGLSGAPLDALRGDGLMVGAAACMALYSIGSRPLIRRSGPLTFTVPAMGVGALSLAVASLATGGWQAISLGADQWLACAYLGIVGSALTFFLWAYALKRTTPTRVAVAVTVNPGVASLVAAAFLGETLHATMLLGLVAILLGIGIAASEPQRGEKRSLDPRTSSISNANG